MKTTRAVWALATTLALAGALSACTTGTPPSPDQSSSSAQRADHGFTGPWADELSSVYGRASTDFEREALQDGVVSDSEFSEMETRFSRCLASRSVAFDGFQPGGGYEFRPTGTTTTEEANKQADACSAESGLDTVGYISFAMQRNPDHLDDAKIMAECLVKKKVVPRDYSARDYTRDTPGMAYPFHDDRAGEKALNECAVDPLGLLAETVGK